MKRKIAVTSTFASMAIALMASPALSQDTSAKPSDGTTISCDNPLFAKDTSHARLVAHFGATNVAVRQMAGDFDDDPPVYFSRINPKDSRKGLVLVWADGKAMSQLQYIMIERASEWTAPHGLRAGATLDELENALGKVAQISIGRTQGDRSRQFSANGVFVQSLPPSGCQIAASIVTAPNLSEQQLTSIIGNFVSVTEPMREANIRAWDLRIIHP